MPEARPDPIVHRFRPEPSLVARAQRYMMQIEDETDPGVRFVRQRWEEAFAAVRVATEALREIFPSERHRVDERTYRNLGVALGHVTRAWTALDDCSGDLLGDTMQNVLLGYVDDHEELDRMEVPRYADET